MLPQFCLDMKIEVFSHVGIDVAGHIWIRQSKRWFLIATCLVTRAVALEDLENLETETILLALK